MLEKKDKIVMFDTFKPRPYQLPFCEALDSGKYKKLICAWHRRAGKDICAFALMVREALKKVGVYFYIFPTHKQCRKVIWDSITIDGKRFLDIIPKELVSNMNQTEMKITLINGSLIQLVGITNVDSIMGTNPIGVVFSEYAVLQNPVAYQFIRPILLVNKGWVIFISSVRARNHFYDLYNIAKDNPDEWFSSYLTIKDTGAVSEEEIQKEIDSGEMSEDMALQEYYNDWNRGLAGSYYAKYIDKMYLEGRVGQVPYDQSYKVHTAWDIGNDQTSIIFFQVIGTAINIIDCYDNNKIGMEHYLKMLLSKDYIYGSHYLPHDVEVQEWGSGLTRTEQAFRMGFNLEMVPKTYKDQGIEAVRCTLGRVYIDEFKCKKLIKSLINYRSEWDSSGEVYKPKPVHDKYSHFADAMQYLCQSVYKVSDGMTAEDARKLRTNAVGNPTGQVRLPGIFGSPRFQ